MRREKVDIDPVHHSGFVQVNIKHHLSNFSISISCSQCPGQTGLCCLLLGPSTRKTLRAPLWYMLLGSDVTHIQRAWKIVFWAQRPSLNLHLQRMNDLGALSPRRHGLVVRVVACEARGPGYDSSSNQMDFLLSGMRM